jgi:hypothetical protein
MPQYRRRSRHEDLMKDALECISQFDFINARQLAFWLYADTDKSALALSGRLIRKMLAQGLLSRRRGGDGIYWYVLTRKAAHRLGLKHGMDISVLNARLNEKVVDFLTVKHHQGFRIYGPGKVRGTFPKGDVHRCADGFVMNKYEGAYALIHVHNDYPHMFERRDRLQAAKFRVMGLGTDSLLETLNLDRALITDKN